MRVLVVEDDSKIASFVVNGLKQNGFAVDLAPDGEKGFGLAQAVTYDAAVLDAQQKADNERADKLGLSYDSDGRKVLTGRNAGLTESEIESDAQGGRMEVQ